MREGPSTAAPRWASSPPMSLTRSPGPISATPSPPRSRSCSDRPSPPELQAYLYLVLHKVASRIRSAGEVGMLIAGVSRQHRVGIVLAGGTQFDAAVDLGVVGKA